MLTDETVVDESKQELELFAELDKGIEDMEAGRVTPHDEAMKKIRESVGLYADIRFSSHNLQQCR